MDAVKNGSVQESITCGNCSTHEHFGLIISKHVNIKNSFTV